MADITLVLGLVLVAAVIFDFINGFHDTANAIATVIATRVLAPWQAILMSAALNVVGALTGTAVAATIGKGLIDPAAVTQTAVLAALLGAIIWNLFTWYYGIPSSSSHALVGGLVGAAVAHAGITAPLWLSILEKVVLPFVASPIVGFLIASVFMLVLLNAFQRASRAAMRSIFGRLQLLSSAFMAFGHGNNDAQKTMAVVTIALISAHVLPKDSPIPVPVIALAATTMGLGTAAGGWRIIRTMGNRLTHLDPVHGFAAESSAATVIEAASLLGFPLSTTHVIASTIMGIGAVRGKGNVRWNVAGNMVTAWILTIPASAFVAFMVYDVLAMIGLG
ncbi:MAG: inorganic phosphate transporter [Chloroflexota bacterium]|nr:inorganic phosphate transporter [Chloroflexota bacterium]